METLKTIIFIYAALLVLIGTTIIAYACIVELKARGIERKVKKQNVEIEGEQEFTFIWYKKMINGNKIYYTQPFRTKVKAKTMELAVEKCQDFAMQKMTLVVVEESKFDKNELSIMQQEFEKLTKQFENMINFTNQTKL